jgi:effector-binding domain-containing protein
MNYEIHVVDLQPQLIGVVRRIAKPTELSQVVLRCCGEVWDFLRSRRDLQPGRNVAVYLDGAITLECGAEVAQRFDRAGQITCSTTPSGRVATTRHAGDYSRLGEAHASIRKWCVAHGYVLAGPNWEIYGHWNDDPAKLHTYVHYLLRGDNDSST